MRKYQQLILVAVSLLSLTCLLIYRSENYRLKYVLSVVNFFGQDERIHKEDLSYEYTSPFPIWQRIGSGFHAYSSFWHRDTREITTIVVGMKHSQVSFRCEAEVVTNTSSSVVAGKFGFLREDFKVENTPQLVNGKHPAEEYIIYKFVCKFQEERIIPTNIIFTDVTTNARHVVGVNDLSRHNPEHQQLLVSCLNLISPTSERMRRFYESEPNLLEYFYHHLVIGVDEFIVYDNSGLMTLNVRKRLASKGIRVNLLPFNFPFEMGADANIRQILHMDCELRTLNKSRYIFSAQPNEFLYPDSLLHLHNSTIVFIEANNNVSVNRFPIRTNLVCLNTTESRVFKTVSDNKLLAEEHDLQRPAAVIREPFHLNRPKVGAAIDGPAKQLDARVFANRYVECQPMDGNDEATHNTWPTTIVHSLSKGTMWVLEKFNAEVLSMKLKSD